MKSLYLEYVRLLHALTVSVAAAVITAWSLDAGKTLASILFHTAIGLIAIAIYVTLLILNERVIK